MYRHLVVVGVMVVGVALPLLAKDPEAINIGIGDKRSNELSTGQKAFLDAEFPKMVEEFTGLKSKLVVGANVYDAVKKLESGAWHMAMFQGVELAWARQKDPTIEPVMLAVYRTPVIHAQLVVKKDSAAKSADDLQGKPIVMLSKEHCELFADKLAKGSAKGYFGKMITTTNAETALDDVLLGKVQGAMVDKAAMDVYKDVNPGRYARLKVLTESEPFPQAAITYRKGSLSEKVVDAFKTGMLKANKSEKGREAMANFQITSFEPIPADYSKQLEAIAKAYPPPK